MASGTTRRTSRVTSRTSRAGGGGMRGGSAMGILAVIGFVVLAMGAFIVWLNAENARKLAEANRKETAVVAATDLKKGQQLTPQDITIKEFPVGSVDSASFRDASDPSLIGGTLSVNVFANQPILRNYIGVPEERLFPAEGEVLQGVTLTGASAREPFLRKGQIVSVWRVFSTANGNTITKALSTKARILEVQKNDSVVENAQAGGESKADVSLALSPEDAQKIIPYRDRVGEIKLLDGPNREPPPNKVSLFQQWMGIEKEEKELTDEVGTELVAKTDAKQ